MLKRSQLKFALLISIFCLCYLLWISRQHLFDQNLHLVFCDVGQGDAILLQIKNWQMLVDGGPPGRAALDCLHQHLPWWDKTLEYLVATHPDADHVGGLEEVLRSYRVQTTLINGENKQTAVFEGFYSMLQAEQKQGMRLISVATGDRLQPIDKLNFNVLTPQERLRVIYPLNQALSETMLQDKNQSQTSQEVDANARSIALKVDYMKVGVLLMGDLPKEGEQALCESGLLEVVDILKVGHHGSKTSTDPCFVMWTLPEISIISVGKNNRFGHPSPEVETRLLSYGSQIMRTDELGTIELVTNGQQVWVKD